MASYDAEAEAARKYLSEHGVERAISSAVAKVIVERPENALAALGKLLQKQSPSALKALSWNIAAVNNNPFEYWLTHPDPAYAKLMEDVQNFVESPGASDVKVGEVFTPAMYEELDALMTAQGWDCAEQCKAAYAELAERKIITEFLKDGDLGSKRLMSMPDRMTNTIDLAGGAAAYRPSIISSFGGDMQTVDKWWSAWKEFLFTKKLEVPDKKGGSVAKLPCALLAKIPRAKYPALSEEEEAMSQRLQTVCLAIFDAILVHMLNTLTPDGKWQKLKTTILESLLVKKEDNIARILTSTYGECQLLLLQEVRTTAAASSLPSALPGFRVVAPAKVSKADQNSVICLGRSYFDIGSVQDVTAKAYELLPAEGTKPADGDLIAITVSDHKGVAYLLASFHGDTDGLATAPVLHAIHALAQTLPGHRIVFGMDANTYYKAKPGKQAAASEMLEDAESKGLAATSGSKLLTTTYIARTFLQPQLQKACKTDEFEAKGDVNPKDFILYQPSVWDVVECGADNTGKRTWTDSVIPSLDWPSDHGLLFSTLLPKSAGK